MALVILDRDGVINYDSDAYIKAPEEWRPIPGSLEAVARLNRAGYRVVVASNQSGVGRGLFDVAALEAIHEKMYRELRQVNGHLDALFFVRIGRRTIVDAASQSRECSTTSPIAFQCS